MRSFATELKVSAAYLSDVFLGKRDLGPKILKPMGLRKITERTVSYEKVRP